MSDTKIKADVKLNDANQMTYYRDAKGREQWWEYDKNGNETHHWTSEGYESWSDYSYAKIGLTYHWDTKGDSTWLYKEEGEVSAELAAVIRQYSTLRAALENLCDVFGEPQNFERGKWRDQIAYYEFWSEVEAARNVLASMQTDNPPTDAKGGE